MKAEECKVKAETSEVAQAAKGEAFKIKLPESSKRKAEEAAHKLKLKQLKAAAVKALKAIAAQPAAAAKAPQGKKHAAAGLPEVAVFEAAEKAKRAPQN